MVNITKSLLIALVGAFYLVAPVSADVRLLMVEQNGCPYCDKWHAEIGGIYHKTSQGRIAPLQMTDIFESLPDGVDIDGPAVYTPTFILLNNGLEVGRVEGYPGDDFFWFILDKMIATLPADLQKDPQS